MGDLSKSDSRYRAKHRENSYGDCRVRKHSGLGKFTDRPLKRDEAHEPRERVGGPLAWAIRALQVVSELVIHLGFDLRSVLRPVMGRNEDVAFFERR